MHHRRFQCIVYVYFPLALADNCLISLPLLIRTQNSHGLRRLYYSSILLINTNRLSCHHRTVLLAHASRFTYEWHCVWCPQGWRWLPIFDNNIYERQYFGTVKLWSYISLYNCPSSSRPAFTKRHCQRRWLVSQTWLPFDGPTYVVV